MHSRHEAYRERAVAAARNEPAPLILPHPDDIIIDHIDGPKIIGPVHPDDQARCENTIAFCEALLMQNELDERSSTRFNGEPLDEPGSALLVFDLPQRSSPPRLQSPIPVAAVRMSRYQPWPKRKLLKDRHWARRKLGKSISRGYVFPNLGFMHKQMEFIQELTAGFATGQFDLDAMARWEFNDTVLEMFGRHGVRASDEQREQG